jgi:hypothetical protein
MDDDPNIESAAHRDQPMARLTDPIAPHGSASPLSGVPIADDRASAHTIRDGLSGKQVCPFCGSQNTAPPAGNTSACPRCTMEDSAATRQATKARIGPWHVLQTRNPAAPGMRYATLLALVGKGQVTARSVVRGPTTHQLWRFAAHVKGLSREFGVCYSCGESIDKSAANCPHCDRAQEPMGNPDALLESRESATGPVAIAAPVNASNLPASTSANLLSAPSSGIARNEMPATDPYSIVARSPAAAPIVSHAERLRTGIDQRPDPRRRPDGRVLSAMELAAALQVAPPQPPAQQAHPVRTVIITLFAVAIIAAAIIGYKRPDLRDQALDWGQTKLAQVEHTLANFHLQNLPPPADHGVPQAEGTANNPPGLSTPAPDVSSPSPSDVATPHEGANTSAPSISITPGGNAIAPVAQTPDGTAAAGADAADHTAGNAATPAAAASPSILSDRPILVGTAPSTSEVWQLHSRGLDAEGRQDWVEAVRCYQQIELAPKELWPSDVKIRLENAKRHLGN